MIPFKRSSRWRELFGLLEGNRVTTDKLSLDESNCVCSQYVVRNCKSEVNSKNEDEPL